MTERGKRKMEIVGPWKDYGLVRARVVDRFGAFERVEVQYWARNIGWVCSYQIAQSSWTATEVQEVDALLSRIYESIEDQENES